MCFVALGIVSFLLGYVVPKSSLCLQHNGQVLPRTTRLLLALSSFVQHFGLPILVIQIFSLFIFKKLLEREHFKFHYHSLFRQTTLIKYGSIKLLILHVLREP